MIPENTIVHSGLISAKVDFTSTTTQRNWQTITILLERLLILSIFGFSIMISRTISYMGLLEFYLAVVR